MYKSPGPDEMYPRLLQETKEEIARVQTKSFNTSPATGEMPDDWRIVNVVPLFKGSKVMPVHVAYMNFSKAFDKVPHGRLVQK
eukprot:g25755.t1